MGWKFWKRTIEKGRVKEHDIPRIMIASPTGSFPLGGASLFTPDDVDGYSQMLSQMPVITDKETKCTYRAVAIIYALVKS